MNFLLQMATVLLFVPCSKGFADPAVATDTVAGFFEIERGDEWSDEVKAFESRLLLEGKPIKTVGSQYTQIAEKYTIQGATVLVFSVPYGGSGTTPDYFIIEFNEDKNLIITDLVSSADYSFSVKRKQDTVVIDLGFEADLKKYAVYEKGTLEIQKVATSKKIAKRKECRWIYQHPYRGFIKKQKCDLDPWSVYGLSSYRTLRAYEQDPRIDLGPLQDLAKEGCLSQQPIGYSEFRKSICRANSSRLQQ